MTPFSVRWFAFKMLLRWAGSWVAWWFARRVVLRLAERLEWDWLWRMYTKWVVRSVKIQGSADGPWDQEDKY